MAAIDGSDGGDTAIPAGTLTVMAWILWISHGRKPLGVTSRGRVAADVRMGVCKLNGAGEAEGVE